MCRMSVKFKNVGNQSPLVSQVFDLLTFLFLSEERDALRLPRLGVRGRGCRGLKRSPRELRGGEIKKVS